MYHTWSSFCFGTGHCHKQYNIEKDNQIKATLSQIKQSVVSVHLPIVPRDWDFCARVQFRRSQLQKVKHWQTWICSGKEATVWVYKVFLFCYISLSWSTNVLFTTTSSFPGFASKPVPTSSNQNTLTSSEVAHLTLFHDCILEWHCIVVRYVHSSSRESQRWFPPLVYVAHPRLSPLSLGAAQSSAVGQHTCTQSCQVKIKLKQWSKAWLITHP